MIHKLQQVFHSITKSLEVLYVIEGIKPCARILVPEGDLSKVLGFLNENNIKHAASDFKVAKQSIESGFYSDKSVKIGKNSAQKGYFFVYLSKDNDIAEKAKLMEAENKHKELGLLLGYPECCCGFFGKNFDENSTDLTLKTLQNSEGYEFTFYNNIAARHFDVSLLSHFPHSFNCKPSMEIAKANLKTINRYSGQLAAIFSGILQGVVIYTTNEGIFLLRKYEKIGNELIYGDVMTTAKSKLYYLLSSNKKLRIIDRNNFVVNDVNVGGDKFGVMIFG